jgi:small subunit ribosomal protein S17
MSEKTEKLRTMTGRVISNKMDKTVSVLVERMIKHPVYGKYIRRSTKLLAHDEKNQCQEGDMVTITSCRPISKRKTFRLVDILGSEK